MAKDSSLVVVGRLVDDSVEIGGATIGHVSGGISVTKEVTTIDLWSDYSTTKIGTEQTEVKYIIDMGLTEFKVVALQYALGLAASNIWGTSAGMIRDDKPSQVTLEFIVYGGASHPNMIFYFYACDYNAGSAINFNTKEQLILPVRFEATANDAADTIGYFYHLAA
jgi:hypothetical protein